MPTSLQELPSLLANPLAHITSTSKLEGLLTSVAYPTIVTDARRRIVWVNQAFVDQTGYTLEESLGRSPGEMLQCPETDPAEVARIRTALSAGRAVRSRLRNRTRAGDLYWVDLDITPFGPAGAPIGFIAVQPDDVIKARSVARIRSLIEGLAAGALVFDDTGRIIDCNRSAERILGLARDNLIGLTGDDPRWGCVDGTGRPIPADQLPHQRTLRTGTPTRDELIGVLLPSGVRIWLSVNSALLPVDGGRPWMIKSFTDVSSSRELEAQVHDQWQRLRQTLDGSRTAIWDWNVPSGRVTIDRRWAEIIGYTLEELQPFTMDDWFGRDHPEDQARVHEQIRRHFAGELDYYDVESRIRHRDGHWVWVQDRGRLASRTPHGKPLLMLGTHEDISARKAMERELRAAAEQDRLTGLANRAVLMQRLNVSLRRRQSDPSAVFAVLFIDFDRFKLVNDTLGHETGDELLVSIAGRLSEASLSMCTHGRVEDSFAVRFGGDEFVFVAAGIAGVADALAVAQRLHTSLSRPYALQGETIQSSVSIGIAMGDHTAIAAHELIRNADTAMYEAKRLGRGMTVVFDCAMHARLTRVLRIEAGLRRAIDQHEFTVVYQPIVDLSTGQMASVEALLRWQSGDLGSVSPTEFIPVAEDSGQIIAIGEWVLRESCRQWVQWHAENPAAAPDCMSVNLSRVQVGLGDQLLDTVRSALADTGMPATALQLEITERDVMKDPAGARVLLERMVAIGVKLAMDDFGTGTSSLACLRDYPFHAIKIDKSFVTDLSVNPHVLAVAHATVSVIDHLGMISVAEGIESPAELATLQAMGCHYGQGYLFAKPLPADRLLAAMGGYEVTDSEPFG